MEGLGVGVRIDVENRINRTASEVVSNRIANVLAPDRRRGNFPGELPPSLKVGRLDNARGVLRGSGWMPLADSVNLSDDTASHCECVLNTVSSLA